MALLYLIVSVAVRGEPKLLHRSRGPLSAPTG
jgi:hypothetical protein